MRVLCLVTDAYGGRGGIAQSCRDVIDALAARPEVADIRVIPRAGAADENRAPSKVRPDQPRPGRVAFALAGLRAAAEKPDVVFCNHLYMAPLAALAAKLADAKLIVQLHGIEIWTPPTRLQRWALERADALWCVSRDTRARALSFADISPERAIVLNNTVRLEFTPGDRAAARARFGFGDESVILTVSRLSSNEQYKGHERVIGNLARLRRRPLKYVIAGDGDDRPRLEALANKGNVGDRVQFIGEADASELPDLYRAADLFVLPSTGEGFGIAFLEAMACGTPAIGLAAGGAPDALGDGELGASVDAPDFDVALERALSTPPPSRAALSSAVQHRFGPERYRERVTHALAILNQQ